MNCRQCKENLSAYLDGELDPSFAEQVAQHARFCAACGPELDALRRLVVAMEGMPQQKVPDDFLAGVRKEIAEGSPENEASCSADVSLPRPLLLSWLRGLFLPEWNWQKIPAAAVAVLVVVCIGFVFVTSQRQRAPETVAMARKPIGSASVPAELVHQPSGLEEQVMEKKSPSDVLLTSPSPPVTAPTSSGLQRDLKVDALQQKKESVHESSAGLGVGVQSNFKAKAGAGSPVARKQQAVQFYACSTNDVAAAQAALLKVLDRNGGQLVDFVPAVKWMDVAVLRAQVPTPAVQTCVQELIKFGAVRLLSPPTPSQPQGTSNPQRSLQASKTLAPSAQVNQNLADSGSFATHAGSPGSVRGLAVGEKLNEEERRTDEVTTEGKSASFGQEAGFTLVEIQLQRPLAMKARQVPAQPIPPPQPVQKKL